MAMTLAFNLFLQNTSMSSANLQIHLEHTESEFGDAKENRVNTMAHERNGSTRAQAI